MAESSKKKTAPETLVEDTADFFHTYIGKGVNVPGIADLDTAPSLNVDDLGSLLRIHFVITGTGQPFAGEQSSPTVVQFMKGLEDRIRRLKRSTSQETELVAGGVDGKIDWGETVEMYSRRGFVDWTKFVCRQQRSVSETPENRVLKRLLLELESVFETELEGISGTEEGYDWLEEWFSNPGLRELLDRVLHQNVYLKEVDPPTQISRRTLRSVKSSRRPLYREAAKLLEQYYNLKNRDFSRDETERILTNVYIRPTGDNGGRLFELYWLFRILQMAPDSQLNVIRAGTDLIASWESGTNTYQLYHHSTGPDGLVFNVDANTVEEQLAYLTEAIESQGFFQRTHAVQRQKSAIAKQALASETRPSLWSGVPDILLTRTSVDGTLNGLFVGEVKYTRDTQYIKQGLEELLEYLFHGQYQDTNLVTPAQDGVGFDAEIPVEGALFVDQLPAHVDNTTLPIQFVEYGEAFRTGLT